MYHESQYDKIVYNGRVVSQKDHFYTGIDDHPIVYEVIRLMNGIPLFYKEHLERMQASAEMMGFKWGCNEQVLREEIRMLVEANGELNQNIKLLYTEFEGRVESFVYFIPSYYPEPHVYESGVATILYHIERENPNAKVLNRSLKERIALLREETGSYEAILVNRQHLITEGSRSNVFFVKDNKVITAKSNAVLEGITRQKIMEMMKVHKIDFVERDIHASEIKDFEGAFLTGTSINILPICKIDDDLFNSSSSSLIEAMIGHLEVKIIDYIKSNH